MFYVVDGPNGTKTLVGLKVERQNGHEEIQRCGVDFVLTGRLQPGKVEQVDPTTQTGVVSYYPSISGRQRILELFRAACPGAVGQLSGQFAHQLH